MHNIRFIREHPEKFDLSLKNRGLSPVSNEIISIDNNRRELQTIIQEKQQLRNSLSKQIGVLKSKNEETEDLFAKVSELKSELFSLEEKERVLANQLNDYLIGLPNIIDDDLPLGGEEKNVTLRNFGKIKKYDFKPKDHVEIGEKIGGLDFVLASKLSGSRFVVLKGQVARLERALSSFMLDIHTDEFGYTEIIPPVLVNTDIMTGTGQLPKFEEDLFQVSNNRWLIPTAEVPLTNIVSNSIINKKDLPLRFAAYTQCFRAEAGAAGKDTRGMIRNHQFSKVEMVSICTEDDSESELERMTGVAENILQRLEIPYRVVLLASQDIGFAAKRTYDIEVWLPGQNNGNGAYREISSCSNCGSFQSRRMKARYRKDNENIFLHTLNGSGLAVGRTIIAILENGQLANGEVLLPKALHEYMNTDKLILKSL